MDMDNETVPKLFGLILRSRAAASETERLRAVYSSFVPNAC
jgi:hypothetical protein